jgi:hypothetical protein
MVTLGHDTKEVIGAVIEEIEAKRFDCSIDVGTPGRARAAGAGLQVNPPKP